MYFKLNEICIYIKEKEAILFVDIYRKDYVFYIRLNKILNYIKWLNTCFPHITY